MGGGAGGSRLHNSNASQVLSNLKSLKKLFPLSPGGYFGKIGKSGKVRVIESDDPVRTAKSFFNLASKGGTVVKDKKAGMTRVYFKDGSYVTMRLYTSTNGSPAVELNLNTSHSTVKPFQKIHFIKD